MKILYRVAASAAFSLAALAAAAPASALGWPAKYEGVMLQGFSWDSYSDTRWTNLEAQSDELSSYFKLIWVPNSGRCGSSNNMGYMPQYWFTNHNSSFGTEEQLLSMISTFKAKGTGIIADCVINHRNGVTNWYDFPVEEWNGRTWQIGLDGICSNDEMANASGQPKPTGNLDTGENFGGCRDLDHTNANVQDNCKNYVKCLQEKYGYAGMRYDMVKGYKGQYTKMYNEYADVQFSVGEYWDGNYDAVKAWIDATGKTSAAFDFPCKYQINKAFANNDMTQLVWKASGTTDQPAGLIHFGYQQYAVTFVDNHDTYRDGSKFNGNVPAANAFILMSPGTPCVFLPHYKAYRREIQRLIEIRNSAGIHNQSAVTVLKSAKDCYMAEVTGSKGKVVVKIGPAMVSPSGYSDSDIKAAGNDYCVWTKVDVIPGFQGGGGTVVPESLYVIGEVGGHEWSFDAGEPLNRNDKGFTGTIEVTGSAKDPATGYFSFALSLASSWADLNAGGNRYAPEKDTKLTVGGEPAKFVECANGDLAKAFSAPVGKYDFDIDWEKKTVRLLAAGTLGVDGIDADNDDAADESAAVYFTLDGRRVQRPSAPGLYIRVTPARTTKLLVR